MTDRKRALVLAFHFPPSRGSGVYRTLNWANRFAAAGWETTVVTVHRDWFHNAVGSTDSALEGLIDPSVRVLRARLWHETEVVDVASMSRMHANFPEAHRRLSDWANRKFFPEARGLWYPSAGLRSVLSGLRRRPHVVLGTGNPYATLAAARMAGKVLRAPYAIDYHDAWTLNQFTGELSHEDSDPAWEWEERLVRGATRLFTVNDALADWYRDKYPGAPVRVVENGWEPSSLSDLKDPVAVKDRPVRFGYVGTFRADVPAEEMFEAWKMARARGAAKGATFELYGHLGYFARNASTLRNRIPIGTDGVEYHGPVSQRELGRIYADLDVLVSLLPSSPYVTSGKVYDYLASRRPILAVHTPETGATGIGQGYPLWYGVPDLSPKSIAAAIEKAARAARDLTPQTIEQARAFAEHKTWAAAMDPAIEELAQVARGR